MRRVGESKNVDVRVGDLLLGREDLTKQVATKRGVFEVRILDPLARRDAIQEMSERMPDPNRVIANDYIYVASLVTLQRALAAWPEWWEGVYRCYDEELIVELYSAYREFEDEFRRLLREGKPQGSSKDARSGRMGDGQVQSSSDGGAVAEADGRAKTPAVDDGAGAALPGGSPRKPASA